MVACMATLIAAGLCSAESSRFNRLVRRYLNHDYVSEDRYIDVNVARHVNPGEREVDPDQLDTTLNFQKTIVAEFAGHLYRYTGTNDRDAGMEHTVALTGRHRTAGFTRRGYVDPTPQCIEGICFSVVAPVEDFDTVATSAVLQGTHAFDFTRSLRPPAQYPPFVAVSARFHWAGEYTYEQNTEPFIPDSLINRKYFLDVQEARHETRFTAAAGFGKPVNVTHLYHALAIERELKKRGAIRFDLSDSTLLAIARLVAGNDSYRLREPADFKRFKARLDSAVARDAAGDTERLRYFTQFHLKRIVLREEPMFFSGPKVFFTVPSRIGATVHRHGIRFPNRDDDTLRDSVAINYLFFRDAALDANASWGVPLTARWFIEAACAKRLLSTESGVAFATGHRLDWRDLLLVDWSLISSFWVGTRLLVQAAVEHAPALIAAPKNWPYHSWLALDLLVEDNISVRARFSLFNADLDDPSYASPSGEPLHHGLAGDVTVVYGF
jgi:hypothetical protein